MMFAFAFIQVFLSVNVSNFYVLIFKIEFICNVHLFFSSNGSYYLTWLVSAYDIGMILSLTSS